jgi:hypothetical protein
MPRSTEWKELLIYQEIVMSSQVDRVRVSHVIVTWNNGEMTTTAENPAFPPGKQTSPLLKATTSNSTSTNLSYAIGFCCGGIRERQRH